MTLPNPLDLKSAIVFALVITLLFIAVPWLERTFGHWGIYALSALAGLTDVDAIGLTLARKAGESLDLGVAGFAIVLAAVSNTLVKAAVAAGFSGGRLTLPVSTVLLGTAGFAVLVHALT